MSSSFLPRHDDPVSIQDPSDSDTSRDEPPSYSTSHSASPSSCDLQDDRVEPIPPRGTGTQCTLFKHQVDALATVEHGGLVKSACGTGKSVVMKRLISVSKLVVVVIPWLILADTWDNVALEISYRGTTDPDEIVKAIASMARGGLVLVTYRSLKLLRDALETLGKRFRVLFDEVHHMFDSDAMEASKWLWDHASFAAGFSATPGEDVVEFVNQREKPIYNFTLPEAFGAKVCNPWDLMCFMGDENKKDIDLARSIVRAFHKTRNGKVLCKHRSAELGQLQHRAQTFLTRTDLENAWLTEFPDEPMPTIKFHSITETNKKKHRRILKEQENASDNELFVISQCRTLMEGADTRWVNMVVMVDDMSSPADIAQLIGRVQRCKDMGEWDKRDGQFAPGTVLLMTWLDRNSCADTETRHAHIQQTIAQPVANVVAAVKTVGLDLSTEIALMARTYKKKDKANGTKNDDVEADEADEADEEHSDSKQDNGDNSDSEDEADDDHNRRRKRPCRFEMFNLQYDLQDTIDFQSEAMELVKLQVTMSDKTTPEEKMTKMVEWFDANPGEIPSKRQLCDGFRMRIFWYNCTQGTNKDLFSAALALSINMKAQYDNFCAEKTKRNATPKMTTKEKMTKMAAWFDANPGKVPTCSKLIDGFDMEKFWRNGTSRGQNKKLFDAARKSSTNMQQQYDKYIAKKGNAMPKMTTKKKMIKMAAWFDANPGKVPPQKKLIDGFDMRSFLSDCINSRHNKELFDATRKSSTNMQQQYDKYIAEKAKRMTTEERMTKMAAWFDANPGKNPHQRKLIDGFDMGRFWKKLTDEEFHMGTFWNTCTQGQKNKLFDAALASSTNMQQQYDKFCAKKARRNAKKAKHDECVTATDSNDDASVTTANSNVDASDVNGFYDDDDDAEMNSSDAPDGSDQECIIDVADSEMELLDAPNAPNDGSETAAFSTYDPGVLKDAKKGYSDANHTKIHSDWKDERSDFFAQKAKASGGPIVYFEGDHLRTTTKLRAQNIDAGLLYVANPDQNICQKLETMGVNVFPGKFEDHQWDVAFTAAYLDTTYAKVDRIQKCIDKLQKTTDTCKVIGYTMLPRNGGASVHTRHIQLTSHLGKDGFQCPIGEDDIWHSDHGNVYTRFFRRVEDRKRTATSPPEVDTPRIEKVPKVDDDSAAPPGAQSKEPKTCTRVPVDVYDSSSDEEDC